MNPVVAVPEGEEAKRNWMHFTIKEEGVFWGQCAEFCGEAHSLMGIRVVAEPESDFQDWVDEVEDPGPHGQSRRTRRRPWQDGADSAGGTAEAAEDPLVARGREVFFGESYCVLCHSIEGTRAAGLIGPNLTRLGGRTTIAAGLLENTPENLARWIR